LRDNFVRLFQDEGEIKAAVYDRAEAVSRMGGGTVEKYWATMEYTNFLVQDRGFDYCLAIRKAAGRFGLTLC